MTVVYPTEPYAPARARPPPRPYPHTEGRASPPPPSRTVVAEPPALLLPLAPACAACEIAGGAAASLSSPKSKSDPNPKPSPKLGSGHSSKGKSPSLARSLAHRLRAALARLCCMAPARRTRVSDDLRSSASPASLIDSPSPRRRRSRRRERARTRSRGGSPCIRCLKGGATCGCDAALSDSRHNSVPGRRSRSSSSRGSSAPSLLAPTFSPLSDLVTPPSPPSPPSSSSSPAPPATHSSHRRLSLSPATAREHLPLPPPHVSRDVSAFAESFSDDAASSPLGDSPAPALPIDTVVARNDSGAEKHARQDWEEDGDADGLSSLFDDDDDGDNDENGDNDNDDVNDDDVNDDDNNIGDEIGVDPRVNAHFDVDVEGGGSEESENAAWGDNDTTPPVAPLDTFRDDADALDDLFDGYDEESLSSAWQPAIDLDGDDPFRAVAALLPPDAPTQRDISMFRVDEALEAEWRADGDDHNRRATSHNTAAPTDIRTLVPLFLKHRAAIRHVS